MASRRGGIEDETVKASRSRRTARHGREGVGGTTRGGFFSSIPDDSHSNTHVSQAVMMRSSGSHDGRSHAGDFRLWFAKKGRDGLSTRHAAAAARGRRTTALSHGEKVVPSPLFAIGVFGPSAVACVAFSVMMETPPSRKDQRWREIKERKKNEKSARKRSIPSFLRLSFFFVVCRVL